MAAEAAPTQAGLKIERNLRLLLEDRFPQIWVPSGENRDRGNFCGTGAAWYKHAPGS